MIGVYFILLILNGLSVGYGLYIGRMDWLYTGNAIAFGICLERIILWFKPDDAPVIVLEIKGDKNDEADR